MTIPTIRVKLTRIVVYTNHGLHYVDTYPFTTNTRLFHFPGGNTMVWFKGAGIDYYIVT